MGYCTVQDLEKYFLNKNFNPGDYLSTGKAEALIEEDATLIDSILRTKYVLPVTNTEDLIILKVINEKLVVGTIDDIFREKTADGKFERGRDTRKDAMAQLKQIREGDLILNSTRRKSVMKFNNIDSDGNVVEKRFKTSNIEPSGALFVDREHRR